MKMVVNRPMPQRRNLSQALVAEFLSRIRSGELRPGERLPTERALMERFSVGRNAVREAMQALVAMDIVDIRPGRGAVVVGLPSSKILDSETVANLLDGQTITDLYELRLIIETDAAHRAAQRASHDDIRRLSSALEQFQRAFDNSLPTYDFDIRFHREVAVASRNLVYPRVLDALVNLLRRSRQATDSIPEARTLGQTGHREIFDAIETRDAEAARRAMGRHILAGLEALRGAPAHGFHSEETSSASSNTDNPGPARRNRRSEITGK
jgi:GntR family transcriptional regulator, transcriptional repressor for pyruvate dehydrogenase complex